MYINRKSEEKFMFENATHKFTINETKLQKYTMGGDMGGLRTFIQKSMKQIVDACSGEMWEKSVQEMYDAVIDLVNNHRGNDDAKAQ